MVYNGMVPRNLVTHNYEKDIHDLKTELKKGELMIILLNSERTVLQNKFDTLKAMLDRRESELTMMQVNAKDKQEIIENIRVMELRVEDVWNKEMDSLRIQLDKSTHNFIVEQTTCRLAYKRVTELDAELTKTKLDLAESYIKLEASEKLRSSGIPTPSTEHGSTYINKKNKGQLSRDLEIDDKINDGHFDIAKNYITKANTVTDTADLESRFNFNKDWACDSIESPASRQPDIGLDNGGNIDIDHDRDRAFTAEKRVTSLDKMLTRCHEEWAKEVHRRQDISEQLSSYSQEVDALRKDLNAAREQSQHWMTMFHLSKSRTQNDNLNKFAQRWPGLDKLNFDDECKCGHTREQHEDGTGTCMDGPEVPGDAECFCKRFNQK